MKLRGIFSIALAVLFFACSALYVHAGTINLGTAGSFAVLAGSAVTNTGPTVLNGNLGVSPGSSVTGFALGLGSGTIYAGDAVAAQAQNDLFTAYTTAAGELGGINLTGQDLGGHTLTPGVYSFASSAQLTGPLTLNAEGNHSAQFVFQIGSTLTTASGSSVVFTNGGQGNDLFWQVGSSATLGTTTAFAGNILAQESITLDTGATISCGSALAHNGAVTLDDNVISSCASSSVTSTPVPEPSPFILLVTSLVALGGFCSLRKKYGLAA